MNSTLGKSFTFLSLLRFTIPNMVMMLFLSLYTIVDGIFVSQYVGTTALSAINMIFPVISIQMAIGIMLSTGASAIIAKQLGEGENEKAKNNFSFILLVILFIGIVVAVFGNLFIDQMVALLGASETQFELCKQYGKILFSFAPFFFVQVSFQTLFITAGKPTLGLMTTVFAGIANIVLDYLLIVKFGMGIEGAAIATGIGYSIPSIIGGIYFTIAKKSSLHFVKPRFDKSVLLHSCSNGSSEMVTHLATAVTTYLFNYTFMKFYGEDGVAAISIVLYFQFVFSALYLGYSMGISPVISYKYGADDQKQLKYIFQKSLVFIIVSSIFVYLVTEVTIYPAMMIFTPQGSNVFNITVEGFAIYSIAFLLMGVSIFASALFTAFSDGKVSAIISFSRTFLFLVGAILLLPNIMGEVGIWLAVPVAEALGMLVATFYMIKMKNKYNY
jgi:putative MATE family efflux protein